MATFQVESFNNPNQLENTPAGHITSYAQVIQDNLATDTNIGWGLQQSTPPEKIVYEFKQSDFSLAGTNTANSQLLVYDNMLHSPFDINGQPSTYYNVIQKMTNPAQIALFLETYYERPAKVDLRVEQFATDFYNYFVSKIKLPADIILTYSNVNLNNS